MKIFATSPLHDDMAILVEKPADPSPDRLGKVVWGNRSFLYQSSIRWSCIDSWGDLPHSRRRRAFSDYFQFGTFDARVLFSLEPAFCSAVYDCIENEKTYEARNIRVWQLDGRLENGKRRWIPQALYMRADVKVDGISLSDENLIVISMKRRTYFNRPAPGNILWCNIASSFHPPEVAARHMSVVLAVHRYGQRNEDVMLTVLPISSAARYNTDSRRTYTIPRTDEYAKFYMGRVDDSYVICDQPQTFDFARFDPIVRERKHVVMSLLPQDFEEVKERFCEKMGVQTKILQDS